MNIKRGEKGQVLVLIVLAVVGIFGFAALAIDGGRFFSERRRAQNAADAAAYAAAYTGINNPITSTLYRTAGINSVHVNGYNDTDPNANPGALEDVQVYRPPIRGRYSVATATINPNEYYQVIIRKRVDQILSQFVFKGGLWVEVEAVARGTGHGGFGSKAAVVATCLNCCDALTFSGSATITIVGGDVISNSTQDSGNPPTGGCNSFEQQSATGCVNVQNGDVIAAGSLYDKITSSTNCGGNGLTATNILDHTPSSETYLFPYTPNCEGLPIINQYKYNKDAILSPGIYSNGISVSGVNTIVTLTPGLYCMDGDLKVPGGSIMGEDGVMFYMRGSSSVNITTNSAIVLTAPGKDNCIDTPSPQDICWSGFLFFMPYDSSGYISVAGGGATKYTGTFYAPGPNTVNGGVKCTVNGGNQADGYQLNGSMICYTVQVNGSKPFTVNYSSDTTLPATGVLELSQ